LPPDLRDGPAYALNSYNETSEFHPRHRAGNLGDMDFFNQEYVVILNNDEEDNEDEGQDDEEDDGHDDALFYNASDSGGVNQEVQPEDLTKEEAIEMAIAQIA
jgi:hypothetical protein